MLRNLPLQSGLNQPPIPNPGCNSVRHGTPGCPKRFQLSGLADAHPQPDERARLRGIDLTIKPKEVVALLADDEVAALAPRRRGPRARSRR